MENVNAIGDSQVVRFMNYLRYDCKVKSIHSVGLSGATVGGVKKFLKANRSVLPLEGTICVFCGTNDVLRASDMQVFRNDYRSLIKLIRNVFRPKLLVLVSVPPLIRIRKDQARSALLQGYNEYIASFARRDCKVLRWVISGQDAESIFQYRYRNTGRPDLIHLNKLGFRMLADTIQESLCNHDLIINTIELK